VAQRCRFPFRLDSANIANGVSNSKLESFAARAGRWGNSGLPADVLV